MVYISSCLFLNDLIGFCFFFFFFAWLQTSGLLQTSSVTSISKLKKKSFLQVEYSVQDQSVCNTDKKAELFTWRGGQNQALISQFLLPSSEIFLQNP